MRITRAFLLFLFVLPAYHAASPADHFVPSDRRTIASMPDDARITVIVLGHVESPYAVKYLDRLGYTILSGPKLAILSEILKTPYMASLNREYRLFSLAANLGEGLPLELAGLGRRETVNGSGITVAVIDTGVDDSHPSLQNVVVGRYDARNEFPEPTDLAGHGTLVAATIAGEPISGDLHFSTTGLAPDPGYAYPFAVYIPNETDVTVRLTRSNEDPGYDMVLQIRTPSGGVITVDSSTESSHVEQRSGHVTNGTLRILAGTSSSSSGSGFARYLEVSFHSDYPMGGGIAQGAKIYAIKVFQSAEESTDTQHILDGIEHAIEVAPIYNIRVVNLSLGTTGQDLALDEAMRTLVETYHILPVVAAGNSGPSYGTVGSPAESPRSLAVGAATLYGSVAYYSSRGNITTNVPIYTIKPDVLAVGGGIYVGARIEGADTNDADSGYPSDLYEDDFTAMIGTSFAAPVVAGIAALVFSAGIDDPYLVKYLILSGTYETRNITPKDAPPGGSPENEPEIDRVGKDPVEGFGMTYLPAIMNAALREYDYGSMPNITMSFGPGLGEPKVYAYVVNAQPGENVTFTLMGTATLDVDLLVYSLDTNEIRANLGNPVPVSVSTSPTSRESVSFIANATKYLVVVRRVSGSGNVTMIYKKIEDTTPPEIGTIKAFMIYKYLSLSAEITDDFGVTKVLLKDQNGKVYYLKPRSDTERYYSGFVDVVKLEGKLYATDIGGNTVEAEVKANGYIGLAIVALVAAILLGVAIILISKAGERVFSR